MTCQLCGTSIPVSSLHKSNESELSSNILGKDSGNGRITKYGIKQRGRLLSRGLQRNHTG